MTITNIKTFENQNLKSNKHYFTGTLSISEENINRIDYEIDKKSITDILTKIYNSPTPQIKIEIRQLDNYYKIVNKIFKVGNLCVKKDKFGIEDWFVGSFPLGTYLFELVDKDKELEILIEDFLELNNTGITEAEVSNERQQRLKVS